MLTRYVCCGHMQHWLPCVYVRPILDLFSDSYRHIVQMQEHDQAYGSPLGLTLAGRAREWDRRALALNPFRATKPEVACTAVSCVMTSKIHACMNACMNGYRRTCMHRAQTWHLFRIKSSSTSCHGASCLPQLQAQCPVP